MLEAAQQLLAFAHDPPHHAMVESLSEQERRILTLFAEGRSSAAIAKALRISPIHFAITCATSIASSRLTTASKRLPTRSGGD
jgi:FixJ family two-component response regulator